MTAKPMPTVASGEWVEIGRLDFGRQPRSAVVCGPPQPHHDASCCIEVVYLDAHGRAINEDLQWNGTHWEFAEPGPCGGYADNHSRLRSFVSVLRRGRYV